MLASTASYPTTTQPVVSFGQQSIKTYFDIQLLIKKKKLHPCWRQEPLTQLQLKPLISMVYASGLV
ncbi:hypothetical protein [uncultured Cytophaga sp.]|uniref:hypothetical protein n=1 Tax=uncultured Cytophaga sp. TaxID=160238 RepID=UPI002628B40C|nr:hypothetical protein [uncultured Cytophaga sp.]